MRIYTNVTMFLYFVICIFNGNAKNVWESNSLENEIQFIHLLTVSEKLVLPPKSGPPASMGN